MEILWKEREKNFQEIFKLKVCIASEIVLWQLQTQIMQKNNKIIVLF